MEKETFQTVCKKGQGNSIGTLLRQIAYNSISCWRPIGYEIDRKSTSILHTEGDVVQDMIEFAFNLAQLQFEANGEIGTDFLKEQYTFRGVLNSSEMQNGNKLNCITNNQEVLNVIGNGELTILVYFRKTSGVHSVDSNVNFLTSKGTNIDNIKVMASTHSVINTFTFGVEEHNLDEELLKLNVSSKSINAKAVVLESAKVVMGSLNDLISNLH